MRNELMNKLSRTFYTSCFKLKKHSPEILIVAGAVGTVATIVLACKATLKVNDILDEAKETIDVIHDCVEKEKVTSDGEVYTQEIANKDLLTVYAQTGWKFAKLYGPSVILGFASMSCMIGSSMILRKRNLALAAAYTAVETGFKEYRGRVVERFGKDMDRELFYNVKAKEIETVVGKDDDGNEIVEKKTVHSVDPNVTHDIYSTCYCEGSTGWTKNAELNKAFLLAQQNYANDKLKRQGYLMLNDVYDMLGSPRTGYGQLAGWVYTEDSSLGDNYVDFGIFNIDSEKACDFVKGLERSIFLDFNCIGDAYKYI